MVADNQSKPSAAGVWRTFADSPLAVKAVLGGIFVNRLGGFLNIFLVLFLTSQHYTDSQATVALGLYGAGSVVGLLVGGTLADRLGARNSTVLSLAGSAVPIVAILYLPAYALVLIVVTLVGAISQIWRPASATLLSTLTSDERQVMIFALYRFCLNLGTTAAPLIGYGLYHLGGDHYNLLFYGEALVALAYALLALWALPGKLRDRTTSVAAGPSVAEARESYAAVLRDRRFTLYLFAMVINAIVYTQYLSTLPLDVKATGVPVVWYTAAVALNGFVVIAFELLMTKASQKWPFKVTAGTAFLLNAIGFAVYGLPLGPALILTGTLIWTLGEIVGGPTAFAYPGIAAPAHLRSRYIGAFQFMFGVGSALGPVIGGALFVALGHRMWPVLGLLGVVGCVLGVTAISSKRSSDPAAPVSVTEHG